MTDPAVTLHPSPLKPKAEDSKATVIDDQTAKHLPLSGPGSHMPNANRESLAQRATQKALRVANAGGESPPVARLPSSQALALEKTRAFAESLEVAEQAGVQLARATFMTKLLGAGICAVAVGVAAALTGVTFGVGAGLLAVASVRLAVAVGDAGCAYKTYKEACEIPPTKSLPLGANSLGNLLHKTVFSYEKNPDQRVRKATLAAGAVNLGLAAAATALSLGAAAPEAVGRGLRYGCSALLGLMWRTDSRFADQSDAASAAMRQARREAYVALRNALGEKGAASRDAQRLALETLLLEDPGLKNYAVEVNKLWREASDKEREENLAPVANRAFANASREMTYATLFSGPGIGLLLKALA